MRIRIFKNKNTQLKHNYVILVVISLLITASLAKIVYASYDMTSASLIAPSGDINVEEGNTFTMTVECCTSGSGGGYNDPEITFQYCIGTGCTPTINIPSSNGLLTVDTNPASCGNDCKNKCGSRSITVKGNTAGDYVIDGFCDTSLSGPKDTSTQAVTVNVPSGDTCDYTSGDFIIDASENCVVDAEYDLGGNDLICNGGGSIDITSTIYNYGKIVAHDCNLVCRTTLCFA